MRVQRQRGGRDNGLLPVAPAASRMRVVWPWLLAPPVFIALFAVHQTLKRQRRAPNVGGAG